MNSIRINIEANEEQQEILISQLSDLGAQGFEQTDDYLLAYFQENLFRSYDVNDVLKNYSYTSQVIPEQNWNEVWESNFQPVVIDKFCAIRAEFHKPLINDVEHEIIITPKMSFGTGHHATTYMMVEQMQQIDFKNKTVFDFGTGTGILSILSEKLGAVEVVAIDVDDWSIANAQENIEKNQCSKISVILSSQIPSEKFDVVLANINRNVILNYLPALNQCLIQNGCLLLSGLLTSDKADVVNACSQQKLKLVKEVERNTWISLLFNKGL
jgi:ribosomal protein L11 methyltransferase